MDTTLYCIVPEKSRGVCYGWICAFVLNLFSIALIKLEDLFTGADSRDDTAISLTFHIPPLHPFRLSHLREGKYRYIPMTFRPSDAKYGHSHKLVTLIRMIGFIGRSLLSCRRTASIGHRTMTTMTAMAPWMDCLSVSPGMDRKTMPRSMSNYKSEILVEMKIWKWILNDQMYLNVLCWVSDLWSRWTINILCRRTKSADFRLTRRTARLTCCHRC